jgi:hypothetical protein
MSGAWSSTESLAHYACHHTGQEKFALDTAFALIDAIAQAGSRRPRPNPPPLLGSTRFVTFNSNWLVAMLAGTSFAAGLNVYATVATLGLLARAGVVELPPSINSVQSWVGTILDTTAK